MCRCVADAINTIFSHHIAGLQSLHNSFRFFFAFASMPYLDVFPLQFPLNHYESCVRFFCLCLSVDSLILLLHWLRAWSKECDWFFIASEQLKRGKNVTKIKADKSEIYTGRKSLSEFQIMPTAATTTNGRFVQLPSHGIMSGFDKIILSDDFKCFTVHWAFLFPLISGQQTTNLLKCCEQMIEYKVI